MIQVTLEQFTKQDYAVMLYDLTREYISAFKGKAARKKIPYKIVQVLDTDAKGAPFSTVSVLYGRLPLTHWFGSKTVYVRDSSAGSIRHSTTILHNNFGGRVAVFDANNLTMIRCGLMAIMAAELHREVLNENTKVAIIGAGKVNWAIARILNIMYGVKHFYVKSRSSTNSFITALKEVGCCGYHIPDKLFGCDIASSATTNCELTGLTNYSHVKASLYLSWDTGYGFAPFFRSEYHHYSDFPEQLTAVRDIEFPWDYNWEEPECLADLQFDLTPMFVSFYGVGLADISVAKYVYEKGLRG